MSVSAAALSLSPACFSRIAELAKRGAGIALTAAKKDMVQSRLARRVRAMRLDGFETYCNLLEANPAHPEHRQLINALTTNVTRFFREPHHFEELRDLLPDLAKQANAGRPVRLWSAACSTGEEAYSIALSIATEAPALMDANFRILATDINDVVLGVAREGRYPVVSLSAAPQPAVSRYFTIEGGEASATPRLKSLIAFKSLNLIGDWPMRGKFQAIFCRNVLIYFDAETQYEVVRRFSEYMSPGATLFLGHSERVDPRLEERFARSGHTSYRRR